MLRKPATIICDSARRAPASSQTGNLRDFSGHHRYYGGSAVNGGEQIVETRRGARRRVVNPMGPQIACFSKRDNPNVRRRRTARC